MLGRRFFYIICCIGALLLAWSRFLSTNPSVTELPIYRKAVYVIPDQIRPAYFLSTSEHAIANLLYDGLFSVNSDLEVVPNLVKTWQIDPDGRIYRFLLKDITFHDGSILSAHDVKYSIVQLLNEDSPVKDTYGRIIRIDVINNHLLEIELAQAFPSFPLLLAAPFAKITKNNPQQIYPLGTGPFKFASLTRSPAGNKILSLERFPGYHSQMPLIRYMELWEISEDEAISLVRQGLIHDTANWISRSGLCQDNDACTEYDGPTAVTWLVAFNVKDAQLRNMELRKCLVETFDQMGFIHRFIPDHIPATSYLPPTLPGSSPSLPPQSNHNAVPECRHFSGTNLYFDYAVDLKDSAAMCEYVRDMYLPHDIQIRCRALMFDELLKNIRTGQAQLSFIAMTLDLPDVEYFLNVFESTASFNMSNYHSKSVDDLLEQSRSETNKSFRAQYYRKINSELYDNFITLNISYPPHISYRHKCLDNFVMDIVGDSYIDYTALRISPDCARVSDFGL